MAGLITGYVQIRSGFARIMAVEAHSKASNMLNPKMVERFCLDPVLHRPLQQDPKFIAGMEMNRYLFETGTTKEQCALVSVKNKRNALDNPIAAYGDIITVEDVMNSEIISHPLKRLDMHSTVDGAICIVLASEDAAKALTDKPIWIRGVGLCGDTSSLEYREWGNAIYTEVAADMAYKTAGITNPRQDIDVVEVDDSFSYKELQHLEALRFCRRGEAGLLTQEGMTARGGSLPTNVSGGCLGEGRPLTATGLARALEIILQLRGEAGRRQVKGANVGLAHYWRGLPGTRGGVIILSN
jgi:acetyl-CoA C-acetyltransferase